MKLQMRRIWTRLTSGTERTALLKRNMLFSVAIRAVSIAVGFLLVPMTIDFVNPVQYGIWLTISSVVGWMSLFDIGFSNGLRNRLTEALASGDTERGRSLVTTTYVMLAAIFGSLMPVMLAVVWLVDVSPLLDLDMSYEPDLKVSLSLLVVFFCTSFVVRTLSYVLMAYQRFAYGSLVEMLGQASTLVVVWAMRGHLEGSLSVLALALTLPPLVTWLVASAYCYTHRYRDVRPTVGYFHRQYIGDLMGLGIKFFIIQIAAVVQFATANVLIARLFSMAEVTNYNIAYKYFNVINMAFMLVLQPFWSAVTDAYAKGDMEWIRRSVNRFLALAALALGAGLLMLAMSPWVYDVWIGASVRIEFSLSAWMLCYFMTSIYGAIFCMFVNGIGALRLQFVCSLISPLVYIALTLFLSHGLHWGMASILIASIVANFYGIIIAPLQYRMVMAGKRTGIWTT